MRRTCAGCLGMLVWAAAVAAAESPPTPLEEVWESAQVDGVKIGFLHTTVVALEGPGGKRLRAAADLDLSFRRNNALVRVRMEQGTEETPEGRVLAVFMRQFHGSSQSLALEGVLEEGKMHVKVDGGRIERRLRWSDEVVGLYRRDRLFRERKPRPGDVVSFLTYEPTYNTVVRVRATAREPEEMSLPGSRKALLRVDLIPDKLEAGGSSVQPPSQVWWLGEDFLPQRRQIELEGLGRVILTRTTAALAGAGPSGSPRPVDIGLKTLVPLNRVIPQPYATRSAVYRITLSGDPDPATTLVSDSHQEVRNLRGNTLELYVHPVRPGRSTPVGEEKGPAEFLADCPYINWKDPRVRDVARAAAGAEKDPWRKAQRLERWVKQNMRPDHAAPMVPAAQVARDPRGDCRNYALLTAALCRAEGIPARTALGLLYVKKEGQRPQMGFHMWTEVWVAGRWLGLDGTLGQGGVSACHVKITDHDWNDVQSLTPFLPVNRILGKVSMEVVTWDPGD